MIAAGADGGLVTVGADAAGFAATMPRLSLPRLLKEEVFCLGPKIPSGRLGDVEALLLTSIMRACVPTPGTMPGTNARYFAGPPRDTSCLHA
jgi:hypothetical protein